MEARRNLSQEKNDFQFSELLCGADQIASPEIPLRPSCF